MQKRLFLLSAAFLLSIGIFSTTQGARSAPGAGVRVLKAAGDLYSSLGPELEKQALFDYSSEERFNWHFIPRERKGVPLKSLNEDQRARVRALLEAGFSEAGVRRAREIMGLEDVLRELEGPNRQFPRDPLLYFVSFFGKPSATERWGFRFEGHHLSASFTLKGNELLSVTPLVQGANPALVKDGPKKGLRLFADEEDLARSLVGSLDADQLKSARGEGDPEEVPGTQKQKYPGPFPQGITAGQLRPDQREALKKLVRQYKLSIPEESSALIEKALEDDPAALHFAWRGGLKSGEGHSYLIHHPLFLVNYINAQNNAAHVHACLRILKGELGAED